MGVKNSSSLVGIRSITKRKFLIPFGHSFFADFIAVTLVLFMAVPPGKTLTVDIPSEYPNVTSFEEFTDPPFTQADVKRQHEREKRKARLEIIDGRRHFVGDEPLSVRFLAVFPFGTRLLSESISRDLAPFEIISLHVGSRRSLLKEKNIEAVPITYTVRLPQQYPVGVYTLPGISVTLSFGHFAVAGQQKEEITVTSENVQLEKVPLYVDVVQRNTKGAIGDVLPFVLEIYTATGVEILNEYPPETPAAGVQYLSVYEPTPPVVLLERRRSEFTAKSYRVVKWTYDVALHDLNEEGAVVEIPPVIWTGSGVTQPVGVDGNGDTGGQVITDPDATPFETDGKVRVIQPDPIITKSYGFINSDATFRPMKPPQGIGEPELFMLYNLPRYLFFLGVVLVLLWAVNWIVQIMNRAKQKKPATGAIDHDESPRLLYDRSVLNRWKAERMAEEAEKAYHQNPSRETCARYRKALARKLVARLPKDRRLSVQESYAMTAEELVDIVSEGEEMAMLRMLEGQLAADHFEPTNNQKEGGG